MSNINQSWSFNCTKSTQTFQAEANVVYFLECYGASGGRGGGDADGHTNPNIDLGGKGGFAKGYYTSTSNSSWSIEVGGVGGDGTKSGGAGGYYLGGAGGGDGDAGSSDYYETGGGGGGATTINQFLTAGGGSGGGSPNGHFNGIDVTQLHNGKGSGGAGGAGFDRTGKSGGCVNGGTAPQGGGRGEQAQPGCNYIGGVTKGTHGTNPNRGNGSAKITVKALKPTIRITGKTNDTISISFNYQNAITDSTLKTVKVSLGGKETEIHRVTTSPIEDITHTWNIPTGVYDAETITFTIDNGFFTTTTTITLDNKPPTITFPQETWSKPWGYNTTIQNAYEGTDTSDTSLDYEVEHYVENVKIGNTLKTKDNTFNTNNFIPYNTETHTFLKVRALQSADTEGGTGTDIWSEWYTSPTTTYTNIPEIITFKPDFLDKIFLQGETKACGELFSCVDPNVQSLEVTHIINEVEDSTSTIEVSQGVEGATITPPLKYHIYNPKDWQYTYQLKIRAKNSIGHYSKYYLSPKTKAEYNVAPKDPTFITKAFKDIYVVNEKFRVEWNKVTDPNGTDVTYDLALLNSEGVSLATWTNITDTFKEVVIPNVSPQTGCYFTVTAFSDSLYSSRVSSKPFAITDVNITDCNLTFPNLTTNLAIEKVNEIAIVINGDTRIIKTTNLSNYVLPLHYFRSGKNTLTLKVKDKINTVIERTWDVNLTLDKANLVSSEQPTVTGYFAFNYDNAEHFNKAVELQKSNIDLGVVEHTFLGSTPFEGSNTVTQKLEITRKANDDTTQLRTIKITGAIE